MGSSSLSLPFLESRGQSAKYPGLAMVATLWPSAFRGQKNCLSGVSPPSQGLQEQLLCVSQDTERRCSLPVKKRGRPRKYESAQEKAHADVVSKRMRRHREGVAASRHIRFKSCIARPHAPAHKPGTIDYLWPFSSEEDPLILIRIPSAGRPYFYGLSGGQLGLCKRS